MCSLIQYKSITTTLARAKEIRRYTEKLITLAKKGTLASRRLVIARLDNLEAATELVDRIAPKIPRDSGYLRIVRAGYRQGDHSEMATISFVDLETITAPVSTPASKEQPVDKPNSAPTISPKEPTPTEKPAAKETKK